MQPRQPQRLCLQDTTRGAEPRQPSVERPSSCTLSPYPRAVSRPEVGTALSKRGSSPSPPPPSREASAILL